MVKDPEHKLSQWFKRKEVCCRCGCGKDDVSCELLNILDSIRNCIGKPVILNSVCRCPNHNKKEGGKSTSAHLAGLAVDIKCTSSRMRYGLLKIVISMDEIKRIGIAKSFIHIDIDSTKPRNVVWMY